MKRLRIIVSGKVQGVFFRANAQKVAHELGLLGFVRNEENEDVYLEVQGSEQNVNEMILWCRRGPEKARVLNVNVSEMPLLKDNSFRISR